MIGTICAGHFCCYGQPKAPEKRQVVYARPDFYSAYPRMAGDTTYQFECYDVRDSIINADTLVNFDLVRYVSLWQKYIDHDHTYRDNNGVKHPLPVARIVFRYDKMSATKWMAVDYFTNKMSEVKEFKDEVIRRDTTRSGGAAISRITNYYRTEVLKY